MKKTLMTTGAILALSSPAISVIINQDKKYDAVKINYYSDKKIKPCNIAYNSQNENIEDLKLFLNKFWVSDESVKTDQNNIVKQVLTQIGITEIDEFVTKFNNFKTGGDALVLRAFKMIIKTYDLYSKRLNLKLKTDRWNNADLNQDLRFLRVFKNLNSLEITTVYKNSKSTTFNPSTLKDIKWFSRLTLLNRLNLKYEDSSNAITSQQTSNHLTKRLESIEFGQLDFLKSSNIKIIDISRFIIDDLNKKNIMHFISADDNFFVDIPFGLKIIMQNQLSADLIVRSKYVEIEKNGVSSPFITIKKNIAENIPLTIDLNLGYDFENITINDKKVNFKILDEKAYIYFNDEKDIRKKLTYRIGKNNYYTKDYNGTQQNGQKIKILSDANTKPFEYDETSINALIKKNNIEFKTLDENNYKTYLNNEKFTIDGKSYDTILIDSKIVPNFDLKQLKFKVKGANIFFTSISKAKSDIRNFEYIYSTNSEVVDYNRVLEDKRKAAEKSQFQKPNSIKDEIILSGEKYFAIIHEGKLIWDIPKDKMNFKKMRFQDTSGNIFEKITEAMALNKSAKITEIISTKTYKKPISPEFKNVLNNSFNQTVLINDTEYKSMVYDNKSFFSSEIMSKIHFQVERTPLHVSSPKPELVYYTDFNETLSKLLDPKVNYIDEEVTVKDEDGKIIKKETYRFTKNTLSSVKNSLTKTIWDRKKFSKPSRIGDSFLLKTDPDPNVDPQRIKSIFVDGKIKWLNDGKNNLTEIRYIVESLNEEAFYITEKDFTKYINRAGYHVYSVDNFYKQEIVKKLNPKDFDLVRSIVKSHGVSIIQDYEQAKKIFNKNIIINKLDNQKNIITEKFHFEIFDNKIILINDKGETLSDEIEYISNNQFQQKSVFDSNYSINLFTSEYVDMLSTILLNTKISNIEKLIIPNSKQHFTLKKKYDIIDPTREGQIIKVDGQEFKSVNIFGKYYWENSIGKKLKGIKYVLENQKGENEYFTVLPTLKEVKQGKLYSMSDNHIRISDPDLSKVGLRNDINEKSKTKIVIIVAGAGITLIAIIVLLWRWIASKRK